MKIIKTITHPKTNRLKTNITMIEAGDKLFEEAVKCSLFANAEALYFYSEDADYWLTLEEAVEDAENHLEYIYSGSYSRDRAEHLRTSAQERGAESYGASRLYGE
jgi:hypothetical protein